MTFQLIDHEYLDPFYGIAPAWNFPEAWTRPQAEKKDQQMTQFEKGLSGVLQMIDSNSPANWTLIEIVIGAISQFPTLAQHGIESPKVRSFDRFLELQDAMGDLRDAVASQNLGNFRIVLVGTLNEFTSSAAA